MISEEKLREEFKNAFADLKKQEEKNKDNLYKAYSNLAEKISVDGLNHLGIASLCAISSFIAVKETLKDTYKVIFEEEYVEDEDEESE